MLATAGRYNYRPAALTFFPIPRQVLGRPEPHFYLTSPQERARLLHQHGVELVVTHPFNEQVRAIRAADFVDVLVANLDVKEIWVGPDFALGYKREGDVAFLRSQGEQKGFVVHTADFVRVDGEVISSSLIRQALREGRVADAAGCLGRPFRIPGRVEPGDGRGRVLGFPTANLATWSEQLLPARGVYAGRAWLAATEAYPAAINIGVRPTVTAGDQLTVEAHLLDFAGDLYGQELVLEFEGRIRDEVKFDELEHLVAQLELDVAQTRRMVAA